VGRGRRPDALPTRGYAVYRPNRGAAARQCDGRVLAETVIGLFRTEVIRPRGPWHHVEHVEFATLEWVDWFNNRRLLESIGNIPPIEFEQLYYRHCSFVITNKSDKVHINRLFTYN
jgi:transposase InsO family protein